MFHHWAQEEIMFVLTNVHTHMHTQVWQQSQVLCSAAEVLLTSAINNSSIYIIYYAH